MLAYHHLAIKMVAFVIVRNPLALRGRLRAQSAMHCRSNETCRSGPFDAALAARFVAPINRQVSEGQPAMKVDNDILTSVARWL
jgi:hypothetical protein